MLQELYQELILDHGRKPRNFGVIDNVTLSEEGYNPLCGDRIKVYLIAKDDMIVDVKFSGEGCAICIASSSLMTEAIKGISLQDAHRLFDVFHESLLGTDIDETALNKKLRVFNGVKKYPMRVKCATLPWHTLVAALKQEDSVVSTE